MGQARQRAQVAAPASRVSVVAETLLMTPAFRKQFTDAHAILVAELQRAGKPAPSFASFLTNGIMLRGLQEFHRLRAEAERGSRLVLLPEEARPA